MPILTFDEQEFSCARAVKGSDYIRLFDEANGIIFYAEGISDFSPFLLDGEWETPEATVMAAVGATASMSGTTATLVVPYGVKVEDGLQVNFKAPCDCVGVSVLSIGGIQFVLTDALGNNLTGLGGIFAKDAAVSVTLDVTNGRAYVLNSNQKAIRDLQDAIGDISAVLDAINGEVI